MRLEAVKKLNSMKERDASCGNENNDIQFRFLKVHFSQRHEFVDLVQVCFLPHLALQLPQITPNPLLMGQILYHVLLG